MINIKKLKKSYGKFSLSIDELHIKEGEFISILGQSGSGKSTLLNLISGIDERYSGEVEISGTLSMVFQDTLLLPHLNLFDNVAFGLKIKKTPKEEIEKRVDEILKKLEIYELKNRSIAQLSGGQKQRASIGRALVMKPQILLMDEPFSALDTNLRERLQGVIKKLQKEMKFTVVFVTHDREEAFSLSDRIIVMHKGIIEQVDTPINIYKKPKTSHIAQFLGIENLFLKGRDDEIMKKIFKTDKNLAIPSESIKLTDKYKDISGIVKGMLFKTGTYFLDVEVGDKIFKVKQNRIDFHVEIGSKVYLEIRDDEIIYIEGGERC